MRFLYIALAALFLALAAIGSVLPIMPSVPFALLAAFFAARGSPRLHRWMLSRPYFGQVLGDWEREGAIARSSKIIAIGSMVFSFAIMVWQVPNRPWLWALVAATFVAVSAYLLSRPEPKRKAPCGHSNCAD